MFVAENRHATVAFECTVECTVAEYRHATVHSKAIQLIPTDAGETLQQQECTACTSTVLPETAMSAAEAADRKYE